MKEIWKSIRGYTGLYEVSSFGRIRSLDRVRKDVLGRTTYHKGRVLKLGRDKDGYSIVTLRYATKHSVKQMRVNRLVAKTFIKNPKKLPLVNHLDLGKRNNRTENLEWCTNLRNVRHAMQDGRWLAMNNSNKAKKLTPEKVSQIRIAHACGETQQSLADRFGVVNQMVSNIVRGQSWVVA